MKKRIAVIFGSINSEHDVSVASAASVVKNFPYDVYEMVPVYIGKNGTWYTGDYTSENFDKVNFTNSRELFLKFDFKNPGFILADTMEHVAVDGAFIMLHGQMGEGGHIQGLLHSANIPFTGCDVLSSSLCMDKIYTHVICESFGIPMASYRVLVQGESYDLSDLELPVIVKPAREGSSFGVSFAKDPETLERAIAHAFEFDQRILIEQYIKGTEVGVGILKTKKDMVVSDVDQVNVSGDIFDFQEKYHPHSAQTLPLSTFPETVRNKVADYAVKIFEILDCNQFSRLDFFVTADHDIYFNEVNTIPGFTSSSRYPSMMNRKGIDFTTLISKMIADIL